MKICLLARTMDLKRGGVARVTYELCSGLRKKGHQVDVLVGGDSSLYSYFFHTLIGVPLYLHKRKYDIYHAITPLEAVWIPKRKSVVTFLDVFSVTDKEKCGAGMDSSWKRLFAGSYFKWASKKALNCKRVAAISQDTSYGLQKILPQSLKIPDVVRLGINPSLRPLDLKHEHFTYGYLGQLDKRKRVDLLIDAFTRCYDDSRLLIAGDGTQKKELMKLADGDPRIRFLGVVPEEGLSSFYNSLDVFVFPTWVEGYGLPIVEAFACGKPVVVLSDCKIPSELKERCIVVDDLWCFFADERLKGVVNEDNLKFAQAHSWDSCVQSYIELYEEVLSEA